MLVLGLNMFHGDASAALLQDGELLVAIAEERLNRVKHYGGIPRLAIQACLDFAGVTMADVEHVAVGRDSDANLAQKVRYALSRPSKILNFIKIRQRRQAMEDLRTLLARELNVSPARMRFQEHHVEHHLAHIASAYYCSPWEKAAGFSFDGSGDFVTTMFARCQGNEVEVLDRVFVPHSLGSFYTMICEFIGYRKYGDEGKVMGLAPYGGDACYQTVCDLVRPNRKGFQLDLDYFMPLGSNQGMEICADGNVKLARHYSEKMVQQFGMPTSKAPWIRWRP